MIRTTFLGLFLGFGLTATAGAQTIEWTAGQVGGGWFGQASGMAAMVHESDPNLTIRVVPGGGTANPTKVQNGTSQIGTGLDIFLKAAYDGTGIYEGKPHDKLRLIGMSFSDIYLHMVAAKNAPIQDMDTLFKEGKDIPIAVTKVGSSDEQTFRYLMEHYGTSYDDLKSRGWKLNFVEYSTAASQFGDGIVDYVFNALGVPGAAIVEGMQARPATIMPFPEATLAAMGEKFGYGHKTLAAGTYPGQDSDVPTLIMATALMASSDLSEDAAYQMIKTFCERPEGLAAIHASIAVFDCATAAGTKPAPLHPGVEKYLKERGFM